MSARYTETEIGPYLRSLANSIPLSKEREFELSQRIRKFGDLEARDELIEGNLRFVISVAKCYQNCGLSFPDLVSEGNYGLLEATKRFDETRGFKFITYAVWWIKQSILKALLEQSVVRKPVNLLNDIGKVERTISQFEQHFGRSPNLDEITKSTDLSEIRTHRVVHDGRDLSLDAPPGGYDEDESFYGILEDPNSINPERELQTTEQEEGVAYLLRGLDDRERKIMVMYYGLKGDKPMTLEEIGSIFRLTRERIRQIKEKAQGKMLYEARGIGISLQDLLVED